MAKFRLEHHIFCRIFCFVYVLTKVFTLTPQEKCEVPFHVAFNGIFSYWPRCITQLYRSQPEATNRGDKSSCVASIDCIANNILVRLDVNQLNWDSDELVDDLFKDEIRDLIQARMEDWTYDSIEEEAAFLIDFTKRFDLESMTEVVLSTMPMVYHHCREYFLEKQRKELTLYLFTFWYLKHIFASMCTLNQPSLTRDQRLAVWTKHQGQHQSIGDVEFMLNIYNVHLSKKARIPIAILYEEMTKEQIQLAYGHAGAKFNSLLPALSAQTELALTFSMMPHSTALPRSLTYRDLGMRFSELSDHTKTDKRNNLLNLILIRKKRAEGNKEDEHFEITTEILGSLVVKDHHIQIPSEVLPGTAPRNCEVPVHTVYKRIYRHFPACISSYFDKDEDESVDDFTYLDGACIASIKCLSEKTLLKPESYDWDPMEYRDEDLLLSESQFLYRFTSLLKLESLTAVMSGTLNTAYHHCTTLVGTVEKDPTLFTFTIWFVQQIQAEMCYGNEEISMKEKLSKFKSGLETAEILESNEDDVEFMLETFSKLSDLNQKMEKRLEIMDSQSAKIGYGIDTEVDQLAPKSLGKLGRTNSQKLQGTMIPSYRHLVMFVAENIHEEPRVGDDILTAVISQKKEMDKLRAQDFSLLTKDAKCHVSPVVVIREIARSWPYCIGRARTELTGPINGFTEKICYSALECIAKEALDNVHGKTEFDENSVKREAEFLFEFARKFKMENATQILWSTVNTAYVYCSRAKQAQFEAVDTVLNFVTWLVESIQAEMCIDNVPKETPNYRSEKLAKFYVTNIKQAEGILMKQIHLIFDHFGLLNTQKLIMLESVNAMTPKNYSLAYGTGEIDEKLEIPKRKDTNLYDYWPEGGLPSFRRLVWSLGEKLEAELLLPIMELFLSYRKKDPFSVIDSKVEEYHRAKALANQKQMITAAKREEKQISEKISKTNEQLKEEKDVGKKEKPATVTVEESFFHLGVIYAHLKFAIFVSSTVLCTVAFFIFCCSGVR